LQLSLTTNWSTQKGTNKGELFERVILRKGKRKRKENMQERFDLFLGLIDYLDFRIKDNLFDWKALLKYNYYPDKLHVHVCLLQSDLKIIFSFSFSFDNVLL